MSHGTLLLFLDTVVVYPFKLLQLFPPRPRPTIVRKFLPGLFPPPPPSDLENDDLWTICNDSPPISLCTFCQAVWVGFMLAGFPPRPAGRFGWARLLVLFLNFPFCSRWCFAFLFQPLLQGSPSGFFNCFTHFFLSRFWI